MSDLGKPLPLAHTRTLELFGYRAGLRIDSRLALDPVHLAPRPATLSPRTVPASSSSGTTRRSRRPGTRKDVVVEVRQE